MRMRNVIIVLAAVLLAAGAIIAIAKMAAPQLDKAAPQAPIVAQPVPAQPAPQPVKEPEQRVVVFTMAKSKGDMVDANTDLTIITMPASQVPADTLTPLAYTADAESRNRMDGTRLLQDVTAGTPASLRMVEAVAKQAEIDPELRAAVEHDRAFLDDLVKDPQIVLFDEDQLSDLRLRADVVADVWMESKVQAIGPEWVGRELLVAGITMRAVSLDVTGAGAKPVFYAKVSLAEANRIRAAQATGSGEVKVEPHRDMKNMPTVGHVCIGPELCFEAIERMERDEAEQPEMHQPAGVAPKAVDQKPIQDQARETISNPAADKKATKVITVKPAAAPAN